VNVAPELRPNIISGIIQRKHYILCSWSCLGRKGHPKQERLSRSVRPCARGVKQHYCMLQRSSTRGEIGERCRLGLVLTLLHRWPYDLTQQLW
jgi:hypothetical protein